MASKLRSTVHVIAILIAVAIGIALLFMPRILHGIDHGEAHLDVSALASGARPASRNVVVTGALVTAFAVEKTATDENGHTTERRRYFPLVSPGWTPKDPVHVVYSAKAWPGYRQEELERQPSHSGVLRNIFWEGVPDFVRTEFDKLGVRVVPDAVLVEEKLPE